MSMCKHQMHLINQGIHWCAKQVKDYPNCCNEECPCFEDLDLDVCTTSICTTDDEEFIKESNE